MKIIKFFSFAMLFALALVSCKDAATASTETASETLTAEAFSATKITAAENITNLQTMVASKITEIEAALTTASEDVKVGLTTQLETYKKYQTELQAANTKISESTVENWASVQTEVGAILDAVKTAISGGTSTGETTK